MNSEFLTFRLRIQNKILKSCRGISFEKYKHILEWKYLKLHNHTFLRLYFERPSIYRVTCRFTTALFKPLTGRARARKTIFLHFYQKIHYFKCFWDIFLIFIWKEGCCCELDMPLYFFLTEGHLKLRLQSFKEFKKPTNLLAIYLALNLALFRLLSLTWKWPASATE